MKNMFADSTFMSSYIKNLQANEVKYDLAKVEKEASTFINTNMVDLYDKYFSLEEIIDYINFSKTKSGLKFFTIFHLLDKEIADQTNKALANLVSNAKADKGSNG